MILFIATISIICLLSIGYKPNHKWEMAQNGKRTIQINVRLSTEDYDLIKRAAGSLWPDAELSNSGILLGLAKITARQVLEGKTPKKKPK